MSKLTKHEFSIDAITRARRGAEEWLASSDNGYPRSWKQEAADEARRGTVYDRDHEAPPIAGYEELEAKGHVIRQGLVDKNGQERVHFSITPAGRAAMSEPKK